MRMQIVTLPVVLLVATTAHAADTSLSAAAPQPQKSIEERVADLEAQVQDIKKSLRPKPQPISFLVRIPPRHSSNDILPIDTQEGRTDCARLGAYSNSSVDVWVDPSGIKHLTVVCIP